MTKVRTIMVGNSRGERAFYRFARGVAALFCRVYLRMRVEGREHVPTTGPFVLAPVHRSYIDTLIAGASVTVRPRYLAKDSLWNKAWSGKLVTALGGFPVARGTADREALRRCIEVLEGGEPLVLFPEGERKSGPVIAELFDGAAYVASKVGVPIVPVGIGGSEAAMPKGAKGIRPKRVHVIIGEPIHLRRDADGKIPRAAVREVSAELHIELQRLFDAAQQRAGVR